MQLIKPTGPGQDSDEIFLKDFIKIFRNDEVGDNIIKVLNHEVNFRKKMAFKKEQEKKLVPAQFDVNN